MTEDRKRPVKQFRVLHAYGPYVKGQLIQPTGMYRDVLVRRGLIEEVGDVPPATSRAQPQNRMIDTATPARVQSAKGRDRGSVESGLFRRGEK